MSENQWGWLVGLPIFCLSMPASFCEFWLIFEVGTWPPVFLLDIQDRGQSFEGVIVLFVHFVVVIVFY